MCVAVEIIGVCTHTVGLFHFGLFNSISGQRLKVWCHLALFTTASSSSQTPKETDNRREEKGRANVKWSEIDRSEWFIHVEFTQLCFDPAYQMCCWGENRGSSSLQEPVVFPGENKCSPDGWRQVPVVNIKTAYFAVIDGYFTSAKSDLCDTAVPVFISTVQPCDYKWESIMFAIKKDVAIYIFNLENITQTLRW